MWSIDGGCLNCLDAFREIRVSKMIDSDQPNLVTSGKSQVIVVDGYSFSIDIYRLETEPTWTLEVVDCQNNSHVWNDEFVSDADAREAAMNAIQTEGAVAFMRGNNVIPFRQL